MPSNDTSATGDSLFEESAPAVPFFIQTPESDFGRLVAAAVERLFEELGYGSLLIEVDSPERAAEILHSPDLAVRIHPHEIWGNQPGWYGSLDSPNEANRKVYGDLLPIEVLRSPSEKDSSSSAAGNASGITFTIDPDHKLAPGMDQTAAVLAYYLCSGWLRCHRLRDLDPHAGFSLEGQGNAFALGLGCVGPDWKGVWPEFGENVYKGLLDAWAVPSKVPPPPVPEIADLVRKVVPDRGYRVISEDTGEPHVRLDAASEPVWLKMIEDFAPLQRGDDWGRRIGRIAETGETVAAFSSGHAAAWADRQVRRQFADTAEETDGYLNPFHGEAAERGVLSAVESRLRSWRNALGSLGTIRREFCFGMRSLRENLDGLRRRVMGVPDLRSAFLRLALVGVGCGWLFLGSFLWEGAAFFSMDYGKRVLAGSLMGGAWGLMALGLVGQYVWFRLGTFRLEEVTLRDIRAGAAGAVADAVCRSVREECERVSDQLKEKEEDLTSLRRTLSECGDKLFEESEGREEDPRFPVKALGAVLRPRLGEAIRLAEDGFLERMAREPFTLDPDVWFETASDSVGQALEKVSSGIPIDDVVEECGMDKAARGRLVKQTVRNARCILIGDREREVDGQVLLFAGERWKEYLGAHDTTEVRDDPAARSGLFGVCAVPIEKGGVE